ncbi:MAG: beta strand repeat-containing protein [Candidatus Levyibacteriota bacterium]
MKSLLPNFSPKKVCLIFLVFTVFSGSYLVVSPAFAATGINKQINFQGKLVDNNGLNVADSTYTVVFTLYDASSGGTNLWTESDSVTTTAGIFQVALGAVNTNLGNANFNSDSIYLGIKVGSDAEMTPRVQFAAVPYAFNADKIHGLSVSDTTGTFTLASGKTFVVNNGLTFSGTDATTFLFPSASGTVVTTDATQTLTNKTIGSSGLIFSGAATDIDTAASEGLVLQGRAASSFNTTAGNISFQAAGAGTIGTVQIGAGGVGSTTPDFLGLDVMSTTGDPAGGFEGAMYYNTLDNKFRCFQGAAWTDCIGAGGGSSVWSALTAPTANLAMNMYQAVGTSFNTTFTYGNATGATNLFNLTDTASNTGTGYLLNLATATSSTLKPFHVSAAGNEAITVLADGSVGIGTTTPSAALNVKGAEDISNGGNANVMRLFTNGTYSDILANTAISLNWANGQDVYLANSFNGVQGGKVGIGTAPLNDGNPLRAKFDVKSDWGTIPVAFISGQTSSAGLVLDNSGVGDLFTASKSGATKFVITNAGKVGIGTAAPSDLLDVEGGNIRIGQQTNTGQSSEQSWSKVSQATAGTIGAPPNANTGIASISASVVYNGSLYVGTYGVATGSAEIYRYNNGNSWTRVSHPTESGRIGVTTATTNIASISAMTVYNGSLYVGTSKTNSAEVYRYNGGTSWTVINTTVGSFDNFTTGIDGVSSMVVNGGRLYIGTSEPTKAEIYSYGGDTGPAVFLTTVLTSGRFASTTANDKVTAMASYNGSLYAATQKGNGQAELLQYKDGNGTGTSWLPVNGAGSPTCSVAAAGRFCFSGTTVTGITAITSMVVYNGRLYLGMRAAGAGNLMYLEDNTGVSATTPDNLFVRIMNASGTVANGGTSAIDSVSSMAVYNGNLYVGTEKANSAELYRYEGGNGDNGTPLWTKVSQATAGTIASGGTASIDMISNLIPYNGSLYAGTYEPGRAEIYNYKVVSNQSYSLLFHAGLTQASGEQNGLTNDGSISFIASSSANLNNGNGTGAFLFSHGILTNMGAYDIAEDYGTRDTSLEPGDVVAADPNEQAMVKKASSTADIVLGVYSEKPGFRLSQKDATINGGNAVPIALAGRIPTKVSTKNGSIHIGDYLTSSDIPGVAVKAISAGQVIGQAMAEDTDTDPSAIHRVVMFVKNTYYNGLSLTNGSGLTPDNSQVDLALLGQLVDAAQQTASPNSALKTISTDRVIAGLDVLAPTVTANTLQVNTIKSASQSGILLQLNNGKELQIGDASGSAGIRFDGQGNAFFAGTITANDIKVNGLELLESSIQTQASQIASLSATVSSRSALVNAAPTLPVAPTFAEKQASMAALLANSDSNFLNIQALSVENDAAISGSLHVKGDSLVEGVMNVVDTLNAGNLIINKAADFFGNVIFHNVVTFQQAPTFTQDTAGYTTIKKGADKTQVNFNKEYQAEPIVNTSLVSTKLTQDTLQQYQADGTCDTTDDLQACQDKVDKAILSDSIKYVVTGRSTKGFAITLEDKARETMTFSWSAISVGK